MMSRSERPNKPPSRRKKPDDWDEIEFHCGTAAVFAAGILRDGLRSHRKSRGVYLALGEERAELYARMWAVGLQAAGLSLAAEGIIFRAKPVPGAKIHPVQRDDFLMEGDLHPTCLSVVKRLDLTGLGQAERIGLLAQLLGVLKFADDQKEGLGSDPYIDDRLRPMFDRILEIVRAAPPDLIPEGWAMLPTV